MILVVKQQSNIIMMTNVPVTINVKRSNEQENMNSEHSNQRRVYMMRFCVEAALWVCVIYRYWLRR